MSRPMERSYLGSSEGGTLMDAFPATLLEEAGDDSNIHGSSTRQPDRRLNLSVSCDCGITVQSPVGRLLGASEVGRS